MAKDLQINEALEQRKAKLMAVKSPGRTHSFIKSKLLREVYALELNAWRVQRHKSKGEGFAYISDEQWKMWQAGLESAFWALPKF